MCLIFSRTPFFALIVGVCLELSIRNGICDDSQANANSQYGGKESHPSHKHVHNWRGWEDWLSSSSSSATAETSRHHQHQPYVPLSHSEQAKLMSKRTRNDRNVVKAKSSQVRSSKSSNTTDKTGHKHPHQVEGGLTLSDLKGLKDAAMQLGSIVASTFSQHWPSSSVNNEIDPDTHRGGRAIYLENLERPDGPNIGKPHREAKRGMIDWLSRLIGVQGKTLGEFLREYQVHVLYDLAFTFFKWIFFLYAGLLIP